MPTVLFWILIGLAASLKLPTKKIDDSKTTTH